MRQYLDLLREIRTSGTRKAQRATLRSEGRRPEVLSVFGRQIRFDEEAVLAWLHAGGTPLGETSQPELNVVDSSLRRTQRG